MSKPRPLPLETRDFFAKVNQAVFANPFGPEREALDLEIAGLESAPSYEARIAALIQTVADRIEAFEASGPADLRAFSGRDQKLVRNALLFHFFHARIPEMDQFIRDQEAAGDRPLPVPFAKSAIRWLLARNFSEADAHRYFELVYQIRRAFFFIHHNLVGCGPAMGELRRKLWNNVFTRDMDLYNRHLWNRMEDFSTLLLGETGTGKGTAAGAIGRSGFIPFDARKGCFVESFARSFIAINLSQYPETLIESELFGHRKGAFTGAVEEHRGVFDRCSPHGAIFLDEIGEVSEPVQIKLLQVLQEREFSPVGSHDRRRFEGRVIAATNRPLSDLRGNGRMREDFYYRLCADLLVAPPLRQRIRQDPRELDELLSLMVERILGKPSPEVRKLVRSVIDRDLGKDYPWPGNVRELAQCVRRVLLNGTYAGHRTTEEGGEPEATLTRALRNESLDAKGLLAGYCALLHRRHGTWQAVARITGLDRRTAKKYVEEWEETATYRNP